MVEYEWVPTQCKHCNIFGHLEEKCNKKPVVKQVWRVKSNAGNQGEETSEPVVLAAELVVTEPNGGRVIKGKEVLPDREHVVSNICIENTTRMGQSTKRGECSISNSFASLTTEVPELNLKDKVAANRKKKRRGGASPAAKNTNHISQ